MTDIVLVLGLGPGVTLRIPAQVEEKHYDPVEAADKALDRLADRLGAHPHYWERVE